MAAVSRSEFSDLVGREPERLAVETLLARLPRAGAALMWVGERGQGRTSVLEAALGRADLAGVHVLGLSGTAIANEPGQLLRAVQDQLDLPAGPPTQLGGGSSHRLLQPLSDFTARNGRVALCLDDLDLLHPVDVSSVAFTARRLSTLPVLLLATTGPALLALLDRSGIPVHVLGGLGPGEAADLLGEHHPELDAKVAGRILAAAAGSPLPLVELPKALTPRQRHGQDLVPDCLPLTNRLREVYGGPLERLSRAALDLLTLLTIGGSEGALSVLASGRPVIDQGALDELEGARLLSVLDGGRRLEVAHPMVRHTVMDRVSSAELTGARELLLDAVPDDSGQQAWHLAEAWGGPDGNLADRLERSARGSAERGDLDQGAAALTRAADLSPDRSLRTRWLLEAAHLRATITGEMDAAADALAEVSRTDADAALSMRAAATTGQLMVSVGAPLDEVHRLLVEALTRPRDEPVEDRAATLAVLQLLFYVCLLTARPGPWRTFDQLVTLHAEPGEVVGLLGGVLPDITRTTTETLSELEIAIARLTDSVSPAEVIGVSIAAYHLDRLADCRAALSQVVHEARHGRSVGVGGEAMLRLALDDCHTGQLPRAARLAAEGLELATTTGRPEHLWTFQLCLALVAALRGDEHEVETLTDQMSGWSRPRGAELVDYHCAHIRGLAALGNGDFEAAYAQAASINPPGTLAGHTNVTFAACLDLVEAAVHTHRTAEAAAHAAAMAESGIARLSPRLALRVATGTALAAPDSEAPALFEHALAIQQVERWPFERARAHLAYGARLRRLHLARDAQPQLDVAYETFRRLGTRGWARRAAEELRASGRPMPSDQRPRTTVLTGRDLEIATLAAAGLSNQEIGARLFLSPRTVGSRLYRIFPKLGVSSRAGLRDALEDRTRPTS